MNPKYPIYIISKNRWKRRLTSKALDWMNVPYKIIVEDHQFDLYANEVGENKCLVLPKAYLRNYETCDNLGDSKSKGPGSARNFAWEHALELGAKRHWVMDDNIAYFHRLNRNLLIKVTSGTIFRIMEDFADRYENVYLSGPVYDFFAKAKDPLPAFVKNTRIFSCLLIQNNAPYRWRGRYNEDLDLSLQVLKDGHCTIQYNAFQQEKATTQTMSGGNTEEFYEHEGTKPKSQMIQKLHPDVAKVVWRFNRWHHEVNYRPFKRNKLIYVSGFKMPVGVDNYGMRIQKKE
jgi:hypothetical protein|tara:strand:- start:2097 stop:2963 length:867 start_codon:yes stop_codon:yes gene_type:complete